jgi:GNAT superfamily N-acetyltransferase
VTGHGIGRAARPEDLDAVTSCLESAFFEDPVWGRWSFPDAAVRSRPLRALMRFWASAALRNPWLRMTDRAEAVAVWVPPGVAELSDAEEQRFDELVGELFGSRADELRALFEQFDEHHPSEPCYYLSLWGTHRDHAGRGLGTALIHDNLARIDGEGMPAYLESTNPANLPRYEALGFVARSQFGPAGGPVITTMWRVPREPDSGGGR